MTLHIFLHVFQSEMNNNAKDQPTRAFMVEDYSMFQLWYFSCSVDTLFHIRAKRWHTPIPIEFVLQRKISTRNNLITKLWQYVQCPIKNY